MECGVLSRFGAVPQSDLPGNRKNAVGGILVTQPFNAGDADIDPDEGWIQPWQIIERVLQETPLNNYMKTLRGVNGISIHLGPDLTTPFFLSGPRCCEWISGPNHERSSPRRLNADQPAAYADQLCTQIKRVGSERNMHKYSNKNKDNTTTCCEVYRPCCT